MSLRNTTNSLGFNGETRFNQGADCRSPWFDCSCCPSNLSRFVPSVSGYMYAVDDDDLYMDERAPMEATFQKELLHGVTVLTGKGWTGTGNKRKEQTIQLSPYCVWNHRDISEMAVWFPDEAQ